MLVLPGLLFTLLSPAIGFSTGSDGQRVEENKLNAKVRTLELFHTNPSIANHPNLVEEARQLVLAQSSNVNHHAIPAEGVSGNYVFNDETAVEALTDSPLMPMVGQIELGVPPKSFLVEFVTTSTQAWVVSSKCDSDECKRVPFYNYTRNRFNRRLSATFRETGRENSYVAEGYGQGNSGSDHFKLVGDNSSLELSRLDFGLLDSLYDEQARLGSWKLKNRPIDGVFGLGLTKAAGDVSAPNSKLPLDELLASLDEKSFTISMAPVSSKSIKQYKFLAVSLTISSKNTYPAGRIIFGGIDTKRCEKDWTKFAIPNGFKSWALPGPATRFTRDGVILDNLQKSPNSLVIFAPELPLIAAPEDVVYAMAKRLDAKIVGTEMLVDCALLDTAPSIELSFIDQRSKFTSFELPPSVYILKLGEGVCKLALVPDAVETWILGAPFYREFCVQHDVGRAQLGIAKQLKSGVSSHIKTMNGLLVLMAIALYFSSYAYQSSAANAY